MRIIWSKRQLPEVKEKWIIDAVVRQNINICEQKNIKIEGMFSNLLVSNLITSLDLSGNSLKSVPLMLFQLPSLRKLVLADNKISVLPSAESMAKADYEYLQKLKRRSAPHGTVGQSQDERKLVGRPDITRSNGDIKIRPGSGNADAKDSKTEVEKYQKSSSAQSRPYSEILQKDWQHHTEIIREEGSKEPEKGKPEEVTEETSEKFSWDCPLLEELDLHKNELTSIPKCVFDLESLRVLVLHRNKIKEMPLEMWSAPNLKDVLLQENDLRCLPSHPYVRKKQRMPRLVLHDRIIKLLNPLR